MPTLQDYPEVSQIQSQSPALCPWIGGPNQKRNFSGGSCIGKFGRVGQGAGPKKNTSRFVISRGWHLCNNKLLNHVYILQATCVCYIVLPYCSSTSDAPRDSKLLNILHDARSTLSSTARTMQKQGQQIDSACADMNKIHNEL